MMAPTNSKSHNLSADKLLASVRPVYVRYLGQLSKLIASLPDQGASLEARLTADSFCAGEHFSIAQGFALRSFYPVLGESFPELEAVGFSPADLINRSHEIIKLLEGLPLSAEHHYQSQIEHSAGLAELVQSPNDYVMEFGLPNFFFHWSLGYATLRGQGLNLGKADFDGLHFYPDGFSFVETE